MKLPFVLSFFWPVILIVGAQQPPKIPESFIAQIDIGIIMKDLNITESLRGHMGRDVNLKSQVVELEGTVQAGGVNTNISFFQLLRYDLQPPKNFTILQVNKEKKPCEKTDLQGEFPMMWAFLKDATYGGDIEINGHMVSVWSYTKGSIKVTLGVIKQGLDIVPYVATSFINNGNITILEEIIFNEFHLEPPHDQHSYKIPEECQQDKFKLAGLFNGFFLNGIK